MPYIPIPDFQKSVMELIEDLAMLQQVKDTVTDIISRPRGDLLSFSVLLTLFLSTNGMMELAQTFNKIYKTIEKRSYWNTRLIASMLTFILGFVIFISIILLTVGNYLLNFLVENGFLAQNFLYYSIFALKFLVIFILFLLAISCTYYFAPALHNRWKFISIGGVIATLLSIFVSYIFSSYISNFGTYNRLYGSIGAMIALMVWIYLLSIIILLGFEINASIDQAAQENEKNDE